MPGHNQVRFINKPLESERGVSAVVIHQGTLYLSGILAVDEGGRGLAPGDFAAQLEAVYESLGRTLRLLHVDFDAVLTETIFVTDLQAYARERHRRARRYTQCSPPAASVVQVSGLLHPDCMVELQVIARQPEYPGIALPPR